MPTLAADASTAVTEMTTGLSTALADFSATNVVAVVVAGLAIAVPLVLTWFAFRWVYRKAKGGLKAGK